MSKNKSGKGKAKEMALSIKSSSIVPSIGIDFGNYRVSSAAFRDNTNEIIVNSDGDRSTVGVVGFSEQGVSLGLPAKSASARNPQNTIHSIRSLFDVKPEEVTEALKTAEFKIGQCPAGLSVFDVTLNGAPHKAFPAELATLFFKQLRIQANGFYDEEVKKCAITVPTAFTLSQKKILIDAVQDAGFEVIATIAEPLAAAISFDLDTIDPEQPLRKVVVIDLGQYATEISLVTSDNGILSLDQNTSLTGVGGANFDEKIFDHYVSTFKRENGLDLTESKRAVLRLNAAVESVKKSLSSTEQSGVQLDGLFQGIDLYSELSRARFNMLCSPIYSALSRKLQDFLEENNISAGDITHVILSGGPASIPKVASLVEDLFDNATILKHTQVDETNVYGAAKQAYYLSNVTAKQQANRLKQIEELGSPMTPSTDVTKTTVIYDPHYSVPASALGTDYFVGTGNGNLVKIFSENSCVPTENIYRFMLPKSGDATITVYRRNGDNAESLGAFVVPAQDEKNIASIKFVLSEKNEISANVAYGATGAVFTPRKNDYVPIKAAIVPSSVISMADAAKFDMIAKISSLSHKFEAWKQANAVALKTRGMEYLNTFVNDVATLISSAVAQFSSVPTQFSNGTVDNTVNVSAATLQSIPTAYSLSLVHSRIVDAIEELLTAKADGAAVTLARKREEEAAAAAEESDDMDYDYDDEDDDDDDDMGMDMDGGLD